MLDLQGFPTPDEREYKLKTVLVEDQDSSKVAEVVFEPYYSLAPNQLKDTIKITVLRPKTRGTYTVGITVDTEGKGAFFDKGVVEKSILRLDIKDVYEQPEGWDERQEWLGEFDRRKVCFYGNGFQTGIQQGKQPHVERDGQIQSGVARSSG